MTANEKRSAAARAQWAKLKADPELYRKLIKKRVSAIKKGHERRRMEGRLFRNAK